MKGHSVEVGRTLAATDAAPLFAAFSAKYQTDLPTLLFTCSLPVDPCRVVVLVATDVLVGMISVLCDAARALVLMHFTMKQAAQST
jgi:hypothetical protein